MSSMSPRMTCSFHHPSANSPRDPGSTRSPTTSKILVAKVDLSREILRAVSILLGFLVFQPTVVVGEAPLGRQAFILDVGIVFGLVLGGEHNVSHQQRVVAPKFEVTTCLGIEGAVDRVDQVAD